MYKIKMFLLIVTLCFSFIGCTSSSSSSSGIGVDVRIAVLKGPTAIGIIKLMDEAENGQIKPNRYSFQVAGSVDELVPAIIQGDVDIAAVPANLASVLFNNTQGAVQVVAVHTLGMIYIVETGETISSVADLRGRTIAASGKGAPQEYALRYILLANGLNPDEDVDIEWKSEHTEVVASLVTGTASLALLPQPFVTTAMMADEGIRIALDMNDEWHRAQSGSATPSSLIMGVMIARTQFVDENPAAIADFLDRYQESITFANGQVNETAALVGQYEIFPEAVARLAIPYCNITFIEGKEMMDVYSGYLAVLHGQNPQAVGGTLPSDEFYFIR
ncbi:MAG: PhnD/SsuA/transferrin family substrate-binding protein [Lachnospiraceae bacterium]|jgi:NitT/TauT family transport system substrate-binding protein|nr:PhnD/SsuA/transferrin family substrate-binding protein [Lachnospiraceae bacterium]